MIKLALFDFDGTIADTFHYSLIIANQILQKHGYPPISTAQLDNLRNQHPKAILKQLHIPLIKLPLLLLEGRREMKNAIAEMDMINGIPEALNQLQQNYQLGLITSNSRDNVDLFLQKHKLAQFNFIYTQKNIFNKTRIFKKVLKTFALLPQEVVYIADEIRDIEAAHKAQIPIIAVTWGFNSKIGLHVYKPEYLIDSPEMIPEIVSKLSISDER